LHRNSRPSHVRVYCSIDIRTTQLVAVPPLEPNQKRKVKPPQSPVRRLPTSSVVALANTNHIGNPHCSWLIPEKRTLRLAAPSLKASLIVTKCSHVAVLRSNIAPLIRHMDG